MKGNPKIKNYGVKTRFSTTNQPRNKGRNPISEIVHQLKNEGMTKPSYSEIKDLFVMLSSLPFSKINELIKDEKQAMMTRIVAKEMCDNKNGFAAIQSILDRVFGKATQINENYNENKEIRKPTIIIDKEIR